MNDKPKSNEAGWWARLLAWRKPQQQPFERIVPWLGPFVPGDGIIRDEDTSIELAGSASGKQRRREPYLPPFEVPLTQAGAEDRARMVARSLETLFEQTAAETYGAAAPEKDAHFKTLSSFLPHVEAGHGYVVLKNGKHALLVTAEKITYAPNEATGAQADAKKSFDAESAYAMALGASKNKAMLEKGIRLNGSEAQRALMLAAIERVNSELPADRQLRVRAATNQTPQPTPQPQPQQQPAQAKSAAPVSVPPVAAVPVAPVAKPVAAAPFVAAPKAVAKTIDKPAAADSKPAATADAEGGPKLTRRGVLLGLLAAVTTGKLAHDQASVPREAKPDGAVLAEAPVKEAPAAQTPPPKVAPQTPKQNFADATTRNNADKPANAAPKERAPEVARNRLAPENRSRGYVDRRDLPVAGGHASLVHWKTRERIVLNFSHVDPALCSAGDFKRCHNQFNHFARDWRRNEVVQMDPELMKILAQVVTRARVRGYAAEEVLLHSGYRAPATNRKTPNAAEESRHMKGDAIDFSIIGVPQRITNQLCCDVVGNKGGVGRYGKFAHIDTRGSRMRWFG